MKFFKLSIASLLFATALSAFSQTAQERTIKFGHVVNPGHPISEGVKKFADIVAQRTQGKIKVREFASGSLGGEAQMMSATQGGIQEMATLSATSIGNAVKEFGLLDMPFSFDSPEQVDSLLGSKFGQQLREELNNKQLIGLDYWEIGFRNLTNSRRPIVNPEDMNGLRVRVIGNPLSLETFKALGAVPIPMAFPELYGALESKAMDAQENPYATILTSKFHEVQRYMSITNHVFSVMPVLVSKKFWDNLTADERTILREAAIEAGKYQRKLNRDRSLEDRKELAKLGMAVNDISPATRNRMKELTKPVADKIAATYKPEIVKTYRAEMTRIKGSQN